jgi:beta-glucosidase
MRRELLLPLCLLTTTLSCKGRYILGDVQGHGGIGSSDNPTGGASDGSGGTDAAGGDPSNTSGSGGVAPQFDCRAVASQQFDAAHMQAYAVSAEVTSAVAETLAQMSPAEKASQMLGVPIGNKDYYDIQRSPDVEVAGIGTIRGYNYRDAGRGVDLDAGQKNNRQLDDDNFSTAFPAPSVRAASWDLDLEKRVGAAIGDETAASLNNVLLAPCMNIVRHPYWGRTQETYGEDTYHLGRMATAFTVGLQQYVTGCAKHFAANNIEKFRANQNAVMSEQTLREVYGRHFEMVIQDGGIGCVMASYNEINGVKNTLNKHLLRDILKAPVAQGGFGFQGFVISDWWALPGDQNVPDAGVAQSVTRSALEAGLDVEVPWTLHYSTETLAQANQSLVDEAAKRVLTQKYRFKSARTTDGWSIKAPTSTLSGASIATNLTHQALSEEAELKSAVLLVNGLDAGMPVLPLANATQIAVVGTEQSFSLASTTPPKSCPSNGSPCTFHFATDVALGDRGTSRINVDPARAIGPFDGIKSAAGSRSVVSGNSAAAVGDADTIVVVVGYTPGDEGEEYAILEGGDRASLDLPPGQNELVTSVLDLNKPTVIIVESGSIVNLPWLEHPNQAQATIWAGYGGMRGGAALGKLLFGEANFAGKMPMAWPTQTELDRMTFKDAETSTTMGYFFGYREYDRRQAAGESVELVFPFGHGLSYSTFEYSNLMLPCETVTKEAIINVSIEIQNTSPVDGDEIAMLFVEPPPKPAGITGERPVKELKSFARVSVAAGQTTTANLPLRIRDLRRWEGDADGKWVIDSGAYTILVGKNADDASAGAHQGTLLVEGD